MLKVFFILFFSVLLHPAQAQTKTENAGWLYLSTEKKLIGKWGLSADVQLRSANHLDYLMVLLLRPGIVYNITEKQSATLGYTYFATWEREESKKTFTPEHRIWEQYQVEGMIGKTEMTNRFRLEQRFIQQDEDVFAQRFRYYIKAQVPLATDKEFTKGWYVGLQNELFLNVQNKEKINNDFFDQNRLYGALGYRLSRKCDLEAGYLYRYQIQENNLHSHILQFALYADF